MTDFIRDVYWKTLTSAGLIVCFSLMMLFDLWDFQIGARIGMQMSSGPWTMGGQHPIESYAFSRLLRVALTIGDLGLLLWFAAGMSSVLEIRSLSDKARTNLMLLLYAILSALSYLALAGLYGPWIAQQHTPTLNVAILGWPFVGFFMLSDMNDKEWALGGATLGGLITAAHLWGLYELF